MWKFVGDGLEGEAIKVKAARLSALPEGWWTWLDPRAVHHSTSGAWTVDGDYSGYYDRIGLPMAALLRDTTGGWRLLIPHDFRPNSTTDPCRDELKMGHVYRAVKLSRKVEEIYQAPPQRVDLSPQGHAPRVRLPNLARGHGFSSLS